MGGIAVEWDPLLHRVVPSNHYIPSPDEGVQRTGFLGLPKFPDHLSKAPEQSSMFAGSRLVALSSSLSPEQEGELCRMIAAKIRLAAGQAPDRPHYAFALKV
ncbi:MAG: hypothetical protein KDK78_03525 [Chlamydiia bacterium]|nr:hypothetical protein [Chlamydiia bacterium]